MPFVISSEQAVNPVIPVNDNRDIPSDFEVSPSLDEINAELNGDAHEELF